MARPRSTDRRDAILAAAIDVIAASGLGASTASIARAAAVSNGSLFLYFDTKATLLNQLYLELKTEMGGAAVAGLPADRDLRDQVEHMWHHWLHWAAGHPEKRRVLALLDVADVVTEESRQQVRTALSGIADLLDRARRGGPVAEAPYGLVMAMANAIAETAMDAMIRDPDTAEDTARVAFDAIWRVLAGTHEPTSTTHEQKESS